jgi:hypothetical protein
VRPPIRVRTLRPTREVPRQAQSGQRARFSSVSFLLAPVFVLVELAL